MNVMPPLFRNPESTTFPEPFTQPKLRSADSIFNSSWINSSIRQKRYEIEPRNRSSSSCQVRRSRKLELWRCFPWFGSFHVCTSATSKEKSDFRIVGSDR
jgi:hypothetical protein